MAEDQSKIDADALAQVEEDSWTAAQADFMIDKVGEKPVDEDKDKVELSEAEKAQKAKDDETTRKAAEAEEAAKKLEEERKNETPEQKAEREKKESEDAAAAKAAEDAATSRSDTQVIRDQRALARAIQEDRDQTLSDVKELVLKDVTRKIVDKDGDVISTVSDVMQRVNPKTGKGFTQEEAGQWLMAAQKNADTKYDEAEARAEKIADVQITLKDETDNVIQKYGEIFKAVPGLRKKIWDMWHNTAKVDKELELYVETPVSLEEFFDLQMQPHVERIAELEASETKSAEEAEAAKKATEEKKAAADAKKKSARADRSDIFASGKSKTTDQEEDDWARIAKEYYED